MGIMMPETCWENIDNKRLTVVSCWFSLPLYNLLTMHGQRNLKLNCGFSIPLCVRKMGYFIGPSLSNNMVQSFYYATNNWATCFDPTGPSSGYKIMVLTKAHAVTLATGSRGLQFHYTLKYSMWQNGIKLPLWCIAHPWFGVCVVYLELVDHIMD